MSKWSDIYEKQISEASSLEAFMEHRVAYKHVLLDIVKKYASKNKSVIEAGSGSGIITSYLAGLGYKASGIDDDQDMVALSNRISKDLGGNATFLVDDIKAFNTVKDHVDVLFNNGVMEHFSDEDIAKIISVGLSHADYFIISIPSDAFTDDQRMYGDERFMSIFSWREILSKTGFNIIEEFNFSNEGYSGETPQFIGFVMGR